MTIAHAEGFAGRSQGIGASVALFWLVGLVLIAADLADGQRFYFDFDDRMRALQIGELLQHGRWHDRTLEAIAMPGAYVSPWSRLVDAPYVFIATMLSPLLGAEAALGWAKLAWPPLLLGLFAWPSLLVMRAIAGRAPSVLHVATTAMVMALAIWDFAPGRIDHHNVQLALMAAMLAGLVAAAPSRGGALAGAAIVLSMAVGLECLPFIMAGLGVIALMAALGDEEALARMRAAGLAMLVGTPLTGLLLDGAQSMATMACDAFSAPWIVALAFGGAVLWALPSLWSGRSAMTRIAMLGAAGAGVAAGIALAFPACLDGPYSMIDPLSRWFWLDRVPQEGGVLSFVATGEPAVPVAMAIYAFILAASLPRIVLAWKQREAGVLAVFAIAATAFALTLLQVRFVRFPPAFAPLFLPWLMAGGLASAGRLRLIVSAAAPALGLAAAFAFTPARAMEPRATDLMDADECRGADFSMLDSLPPSRILAPFGLAFAIAETGKGHAVAALPFHRASPGIRRVALAFAGTTAEARSEGLSGFDYVAVCARSPAYDLSETPLFDALARGRGWPGLTRIAPAAPGQLSIWRIDHAALR